MNKRRKDVNKVQETLFLKSPNAVINLHYFKLSQFGHEARLKLSEPLQDAPNHLQQLF
jgi:hypothetical protein